MVAALVVLLIAIAVYEIMTNFMTDYLIFCVSTGRDSADANPTFYGYSPGRLRALYVLRRGPDPQDYRDIHNRLNAVSCADIFRSDVPPDAVGINQQHVEAGDGLTTVYYCFPLWAAI